MSILMPATCHAACRRCPLSDNNAFAFAKACKILRRQFRAACEIVDACEWLDRARFRYPFRRSGRQSFHQSQSEPHRRLSSLGKFLQRAVPFADRNIGRPHLKLMAPPILHQL
jgi:hypothetical protein